MNNLLDNIKSPYDMIKGWLSIFDNLPERNLEHARRFAIDEKYTDAILRLKILLWMTPNYVDAYYLLGHCYLNVGKRPQAIKALSKALSIMPNHTETLFLLSSVDPSRLPQGSKVTRMPSNMVHGHFSRIAYGYEHMQKENHYRGHVNIVSSLKKYMEEHRTNHKILELGCGTGLVGYLIGDEATELDGIDFTEEMLEVAATKQNKDGHPAYSKTFLEDIVDFLPEHTKADYDFILAAHVFNYVGELSAIFAGATHTIKQGGYFIFQVEPFKNDFGIIIGEGRFGHSKDYISNLLEQNGFELMEAEPFNVYPKVNMVQYVARKR